MACLWEVTTHKPGNVHRSADFADLTFMDFQAAAVAIGPVMERATEIGVGRTVRESIEATQRFVSTNVNLGIVLCLAPLACVPREHELNSVSVAEVLNAMTDQDSSEVYQAIQMVNAGGMGEVEEHDVRDTAPDDLLVAMRLAADLYRIAALYAHNFDDLFERILPWLLDAREEWNLTDAIIWTFLKVMSEWPDSLIARKLGGRVAQESSARAGAALASGFPGDAAFLDAISELDFWLLSDGHRRNPGTSADLIAAALFSAIRDHSLLG